HVIRENKMMAFAGADRLQDGRRLSFGKPIGTAARITKLGDVIMALKVKKEHLEFAKKAFKVASSKIPLDTEISVVPLKEEKK
ncbi:MAG: ribosomal protein L16, partial [Metallosphaera sp.]